MQLAHTTPDPVELHAQLTRLKHEGVDHLALEASSHGLDQFRLDGIDVAAAAFTNITRDHLDYHATFEEYLEAKLGLFERLVRKGGVAVVNRDADHAAEFIAASERRGLRLLTIGVDGETLKLTGQVPRARGQDLSVLYQGRVRTIALPLAGLFQASNALLAAGIALGLGDPADDVFAALETLKGAPGRLDLVAQTRTGASVLYRLRAHARCDRDRAHRAPAACEGAAAHHLRLRRRPRSRQAPADGGRGCPLRCSSS